MNIFLLGLVIFALSIFVIELCFYAFGMIRYPDRSAVRKRLRKIELVDNVGAVQDITKRKILSDVPFLNRIFSYFPGIERLDSTIKQANVKYSPGFFLLFSLVLGLTGYLFCSITASDSLLSILTAIVAGSLPFLYVQSKKKKRMAKFEKQLPEALGLIARALKAGHAFTSGMKLAADEFEDPLGTEFDETLDEINFGVSVPDALKNLAIRVDCPDLKFFVVSVILQRETGGNLAEIIESLANLIRERFKFKGKVKVLTAEGRLSAVILLVLPLVLFIALYFLSRDYISTLFTDPMGKGMIGIALFMMIAGIFVINKMIKVEV
jgi:tight adherence protein B